MIGVQLKGVRKSYRPPGRDQVEAVAGVNAAIDPGEYVVIVGHNGSGKTTLASLIAGSLDPDEGKILFHGGELGPSKGRGTTTAMLEQDPSDNVARDLTVAENIALAEMGRRRPRFFATPSRSHAALADFMSVEKAGARARDLSGGQKQLLALGLALVRRPGLLVLDEPTASLDRDNARAVLGRIREIWEDQGLTTILVTHDLAAALHLGTRLWIMSEGTISADLRDPERRSLDLATLHGLCGFDAFQG